MSNSHLFLLLIRSNQLIYVKYLSEIVLMKHPEKVLNKGFQVKVVRRKISTKLLIVIQGFLNQTVPKTILISK